MGYLPIVIELAGCPCLVVGGGEVASRRVELLVKVRARIQVISPAVTASIGRLEAAGEVSVALRPYQAGDIDGFRVVFAATSNEKVHRQIAAEAKDKGVLLNVSDRPALCNFIMPATLRRGALTVAVSTGGASPAFAARMRKELEEQFGLEYELAVEILKRVRSVLSSLPAVERRSRLTRLAKSSLPDLLRQGETEEVDAVLKETVGDEYTLAKLGFALGD